MKYVLAFLGALLLASGCGRDTANDLLPLAVGHEWVTFTLDAVTDSTAVPDTGRMVITADTNIAGETWYVAVLTRLGMPDTVVLRLVNRPDGLWSWMQSDKGITLPTLWAKYPATRDEIYQWTPIPELTMPVQVMAVDSLITVPAGQFSCVAYKFVDTKNSPADSSVSIYFFAKGVGVIRKQVYVFQGGVGFGISQEELVRYTATP